MTFVFLQALEQCMMETMVAQEESAAFGCFSPLCCNCCLSFDHVKHADQKKKKEY